MAARKLGPFPRSDSEEARSRSRSGPRSILREKRIITPTKILPPPIDPISYSHAKGVSPLETAVRIEDLCREIDTLRRERDTFAHELDVERGKNAELENEFIVLRGLIAENTRPIGLEENLALKHQFEMERELRITAEADINRLRQQLADALASSHRDTVNLKKALSDMQATNQQSL